MKLKILNKEKREYLKKNAPEEVRSYMEEGTILEVKISEIVPSFIHSYKDGFILSYEEWANSFHDPYYIKRIIVIVRKKRGGWIGRARKELKQVLLRYSEKERESYKLFLDKKLCEIFDLSRKAN